MLHAKNCFEAVKDIDTVIRGSLDPSQRYFAVGGIATSAIRHEDTNYDFRQRLVVPSPEAADPILRENSTTRDIDLIIADVIEDEQAEEIVKRVSEVTPLVVSVFGLDKYRPPSKAIKLVNTATDWTSRRTADEDGNIRLELFPLTQVLQPESFDPWTLELPETDRALSVLSPPGHMLAYRNDQYPALGLKTLIS